MSSKYDKKIRRAIKKKIRFDLNGIIENIKEDSFLTRVGYAIRIIFKWRLGETISIQK